MASTITEDHHVLCLLSLRTIKGLQYYNICVLSEKDSLYIAYFSPMFTHNIIMIYYRNRLITVLLEIINNEYDKWIYDISK